MGNITLLNFGKSYPHIVRISESAIEQWRLSSSQNYKPFKNKLLFLIGLDEIGECHEANDFIREQIKAAETSILKEAVVAFIILSPNDFFTKTYSKKFVFMLNQLGAEFIGHPMLEITQGYANLKTWAMNMKLTLEETSVDLIHQLVSRLGAYEAIKRKKINLLVLHAGDEKRSNTLMLWNLIESKLKETLNEKIEISKAHVEDGQIRDCFGCSYATCTYHAAQKSCFYGGYVVENLFPKIESADYIVWICPNYNDALSAKLTAVINRLTALYRTVSFKDKYLLGVVVSANSGNDTVASQLLGALCINKGFRLPPEFVIMAQANAPGEILKNKDIKNTIQKHADKLLENLKYNIEFSEKGDIMNI